jgi:toxin CcdB
MSALQQYDIFPAPTGAGYPYFVVLQSDLMQGLATRVVAPLVDASKLDPLNTLWPKVSVGNTAYVVLVPLMQSLRTDDGATAVGNLRASESTIAGAIDLLFSDGD